MNWMKVDGARIWGVKASRNLQTYWTCLFLAGAMFAGTIPALAAPGDACTPSKPGLPTATPQAPANTSGDARWPSKLILPSATLARTGEVSVVYHLSQGFTGHAMLHVCWTDSLGRVVEDKTVPADLLDETDITFPIDLSRAIAMRNHLQVDLIAEWKRHQGRTLQPDRSSGCRFCCSAAIHRVERLRHHDVAKLPGKSYSRPAKTGD